MKNLKVLIVTETFPMLSEAFVVNHMISIISEIKSLRIFSFNKPTASQAINPLVDRYQLVQKTKYGYVIPDNRFIRLLKAFLLLLRHIRYLPYFLKSLNVKNYGFRAYRLITFYYLAGFIQVQKPDIIHCHFGTMAYELLIVKSLGLFQNIPIIVYFHGYDIKHINPNTFPNYHQFIFSEANHIYTNSTYSRKQLIELGCPETKIKVLPVSFDTEYFRRSSSMYTSQKIKLLSVRRLIDLKGMDISIDIVAELIKQGYNNITYNIIGDGPERPKLERKIRENQLQPYISLCGAMPQDQVKKYLSSSDIFLLMGRYDALNRAEAQGLVIQEAQAMELPVIITDVGGMPEGVIDKKTGFIIDPKKSNLAVDKIKFLIENPVMRKQMAVEARNYVESKYSNKVLGKKWLKEYNQILNT